MQLNEEQKKAVCSENNSLIIAGAGSGKTTVLATHVLYLLIRKKVPLRNILVLTFTRKATSEMYERIYKLLLECIKSQQFLEFSLDTNDIEFIRKQVENFEDSNISTIDSFWNRIVVLGSMQIGFTDIRISTDVHKIIRNFIVDYFILQRNNSVLHTLYKLYPLEELLESLFIPFLNTVEIVSHNSLKKRAEEMLQKMQETFVLEIQNIRQNAQKIKDMFNSNKGSSSKSVSKLIATAIQILESDIDDLEIKKEDSPYLTASFTLIGVSRSLASVPDVVCVIKDLVIAIRDSQENCKAIMCTLKNRDWIQDCYAFTENMAQQWFAYKKQKKIFTYQSIAKYAEYLVDHSKEILQWILRSFTHIIVDEVQDNSVEQNRMFNTLLKYFEESKKATHFFFVGDPRQSIYRFRGADIQGFLELIKSTLFDTCELSYNYRSTEKLIHFFNTWFSFLFRHEIINASASVTYFPQKVSCNSFSAPTQTDVSYRKIIMCNENENVQGTKKSKEEIEAFYISECIEEIRKEGYAYSDIAVLTYTKKLSSYLQSVFLIKDIPHMVEENIGSLKELAYDFYVWLTLLLIPEDTVAYISFLRGPIANISDDTLIHIMDDLQKCNATTIFNVPLSIKGNKHYAHCVGRLSRMKEKYNEAKQILIEESLTHLLDHFWLSCGYRYVLLRNIKYHPFLSQYSMLKNIVAWAEKRGGIALWKELEHIVKNGTVSEELKMSEVLLETTKKGVHIMTIHKAKGLEFPVVVLAHLGAEMKGHYSTKHAYIDGIHYINFKSPKDEHYALGTAGKNGIQRILTQNSSKDMEELLRIFYVGVTRVKKRLYLIGTIQEKKYKKILEAPDKLSLKTFIEWCEISLEVLKSEQYVFDEKEIRSEDIENRIGIYYEKEVQSNTISEELFVDIVEELAGNYENQKERSLQQRIIEVNASAGEDVSFYKVPIEKASLLPSLPCENLLVEKRLYAFFGTQCHSLLKCHCENINPEYEQHDITSGIQLLDITSSEKDILASSVDRCVGNFLQTSIWNTRSNNSTSHVIAEQKFLLYSKDFDVYMNCTIDVIFFSKNPCLLSKSEKQEKGICTIVDYKTDRYKHPQHHTLQLDAYRYAVSTYFSLPVESIETVLCYLRNGECVCVNAHYTEYDIFKHLIERKQKMLKESAMNLRGSTIELYI